MKKVLLGIVAITGFTVASFAQTPAPVKKNTTATPMQVVKKTIMQPQAKVAPMPKPSVATAPAVKKEMKQPAVAKTNAAGPLKKDGSKDMRYKANKQPVAPVAHLKKDGSKDMRYKENKKHS
jgi:hypothetical protein